MTLLNVTFEASIVVRSYLLYYFNVAPIFTRGSERTTLLAYNLCSVKTRRI